MINSEISVKASLIAVVSGIIQCAVGAYMLSDSPPKMWMEILQVKFVFATGFFAVTNGFLTHKNFIQRDPNQRTRKEDDGTDLMEILKDLKEKGK